MKVFTVIIVIIALSGLIWSGCDGLVNRFAFFPDTTFLIPVSELPPSVTEVFIETRDEVRLQSYYVPQPASKYILIFFHGNAGNLGNRLADILRLRDLGINVFGLSYRGYGKSDGKPSESGIYLDGKAAFEYVTDTLGFLPENVILFGRSIGTTVAVNTAQNIGIAGLILVTPLTSGKAHAKAHGFGPLALLAGKSFDNLAKIPHIRCPLLVIHGTRDRIIPLKMGKEIYKKASVEKRFVQIRDAGHNDLTDFEKNTYWDAIREFIEETTRS